MIERSENVISSADIICDYFGVSVSERRKSIVSLINKFEKRSDCFCLLNRFNPSEILFSSNSFQRILGYPISSMERNGFEFIMAITAKSYFPGIVTKQAMYMQQVSKPGFNYMKPNFMEFEGGFVHRDGREMPISQISVCWTLNREWISAPFLLS